MGRYKLILYVLIFILVSQVTSSMKLYSEGEKFEVLTVIWGTTSTPAEVGPGDVGQLTIVLRTKNSIQSSTLVAYLDLPKGLTSINGESTAITYLKYGGTSIPAGTVLELQFRVKIADSAALGRHTAKLTLEYVVEVLYYSRTYSDEIYVTIPISGRPDISIYNYPSEVNPGKQLITFKLSNNGTAAANKISIDISLQPSLFINASKIELSNLTQNGDSSVSIEAFIPPSLSNSTITITSSIAYYGPLSVLYSKTFRNVIYVNQYEKPLLDLRTDLTEVSSSAVSNLNLTIINNGGFAKDLVIRLSTQQPLQICGKSLYLVDSLKSGQNTSLPVKLCALPTSTDVITPITVSVDYSDVYGVVSSKTYNLPITLRAVRESPLSPYLITREIPGGIESRLMLNLSNLGNTYLKNVSVQLTLPQNIMVLTLPQFKLDTIDPMGFVIIDFPIKASYVDSTTYSKVSFQVGYTDPSGNYFINTYDFAIVIKPQELRPLLTVKIEPKTFNPLSKGSLLIGLVSSDEVNNLVVSVSNEGTPLILSGSKELVISKLSRNEERSVSIPYVVGNKPGTYSLIINVKYVDSIGVLRSSTHTHVIEVLPLKNVLNISVYPSTVLSSSTTILEFTITNVGDSRIKDLMLSINPQGSAITLAESAKHYIGDLEPKGSKVLKVAVRSSYVSAYTTVPISLGVTYYDVLNQLYSDTYTSTLVVEPKTPLSKLDITANATELTIASINNVAIKLRNTGSEVIEGISYRITSGSALNIIGANDGYISTLKPGESVTINVPIYVTLTSTYTSNIVLSLTYTDKSLGSVRNEDKTFTLLLRGKVDLRVIDYVVMPTAVSVGQTFSVSLTLINVGVTPAYSTFISPVLTGVPVRSATEERTIYLGNIEVGSTTAATITLQLMNTSERIVRLPIFITYLDNLRTPQNVTSEVVIRVSPSMNVSSTASPGNLSRGDGSLPIYVIIIIAAVAVVALVVWKLMRR